MRRAALLGLGAALACAAPAHADQVIPDAAERACGEIPTVREGVHGRPTERVDGAGALCARRGRC